MEPNASLVELPLHAVHACRGARLASLVGMAIAGLTALAHPGHGPAQRAGSDAHAAATIYATGTTLASAEVPEPDAEGYRWWKGNLHTHSLWSDGDQFPEVIVDWYQRNGYHFLAMSDHNVLLRGDRWIDPETNPHARNGGGRAVYEVYRQRFGDHWVETREREGRLEVRLKPLVEFRPLFEQAGRFLLIESEEITESRHVVHVNAANIVELIQPQTGATVEETIRLNLEAVHAQSRAHQQPMLTHLNHPNFVWAVRAEDMVPIAALKFFEVYNGHRGVANFGDDTHVDLDRMWDIVLTRRLAEEGLGIVYALAVDDAHHYEGSRSQVARPGRGWVRIRSRFLTPEHLIKAMEQGDFYASTGVELRRIELDQGRYTVMVQPRPGESTTIRFIGTRRGYDRSREPRRDAEGNPLPVTWRHSDEIGIVLAEVEGTEAFYQFRGDEIYVRAKIISSRLKENPFVEGELEQAWTQPVVP